MPIALGVVVVALLALGFMSMQAMLTKLQQEQENNSWWAPVVAPVTAVFGLINRGQAKVFDLMVSIVSRIAGASIHALEDWFGHLERLVADAAHGVSSLAETVADAFEHAFTTTIPHMIRTAVRHEGHLRRIADEQLRRYARGIDRLLRDHVLPQVRRIERAVTVTIPREFQRAWARDRAIAGRIPHALKRRLSRVERLTTYAAVSAVVVRVIARKFPWLFCRKVSTIGRRVCGLNSDLFDTLLADLLIISGVLSVVQFTEELQMIEDEVVDFMKGVIPELQNLAD